MPFVVGTIIAAVILWLTGAKKRREARRQTNNEVTTTMRTGLPGPETALGQKARQVAEAQEGKLTSPPPVHGTARWGDADDAPLLLDGNNLRTRFGHLGLQLGTLLTPDGRDTGLPLVATYPGHLLTVAGTGQGKSATQIVENLLSYVGSVVVVDPKGELYGLTAGRRREMGSVFRLAPLAKQGEHSDRYNPLDELGDERELGRRARHLAEMLIVRQGNKGAAEAAFFENEAINLLTAILMFTVELTETPALRPGRTLSEVRRICSLPSMGGKTERDPLIREYLEDVLRCMMASKHAYAACTMRIGMWDGTRSKTVNTQPFTSLDVLMFSNSADQRTLWPSTITFSHEFFQTLSKHAMPINIHAVKAFANSPRKLDLLFWLGYRFNGLNKPISISWDALSEQWGVNYSRMRNFKRDFAQEIGEIKEVFPKLPVQVTEFGCTISPGTPEVLAIPRKPLK